jgi:heme exporter protein C
MITAIMILLDFVLMTLTMVMIGYYAPVDAVMGPTQKIFYIHLPGAITCFFLTGWLFVASVVYLFRRTSRLDHLAAAAAEPAWIFCSLTLITGMIWAKQAWSVWWVWDPRLTSFLILWCILSVYLVLRKSLPAGPIRARLAAAFGIISFIDLPIVFFSVRWWNTLHPTVITATGVHMDRPMFHTLVVATVAVLLLASIIVGIRYRLLTLEHRLSMVYEEIRESEDKDDE